MTSVTEQYLIGQVLVSESAPSYLRCGGVRGVNSQENFLNQEVIQIITLICIV